MLVEIDIFSGRPNPRWRLSEMESTKLTGLIENLDHAPSSPSLNAPGLGFRGFRLRDDAGRSWWAYGGFVESSGGWRVDSERLVERFLLDHLPPEYEELRPSLRA